MKMLSLRSIWCLSFWLAIWLHMCLFLSRCTRLTMAYGEQYTMSNMKFPALFAFGDSIVDSGNNNNLPSFMRSNWPPNGKDFANKKATGRFTNGRTPTDFIAKKLGIKEVLPAYLQYANGTINEDDLVTGVSFGSGGSGYDPETALLVVTKSPEDQLKSFTEYIGKIKEIVGDERTKYIVNNSLYFIVSGNCDLANTYFTFPFARKTHDIDSYTDLMRDAAISWVERLYKMGARTIAVSNLPPLGYLPSQRTLAGGPLRNVNKARNEAVELFNRKLQAALNQLSFKLYKSDFIYVDTNKFVLDLIQNHTQYGFKTIDRGCCGSGLIEAAVLCNPFSPVCHDVENYIFWDSFHPTERAYELIADRVIDSHFSNHLSR